MTFKADNREYSYMTDTPSKSASPRLTAPYVPQAHKQGIGVRAAAHLLVYIDPYPDMDEGDLIELFWDGCYVASKLLQASDIGQTLVIRVPESCLQNGMIKIWYRQMKIGGTPATSPACKLRVKLDTPGGLLLSPSTEENQGLTPVSIPDDVLRNGLIAGQMKKGLPLSIAPYQNMAKCDEITLRWGDSRMDLPPLGAANIGKPVHLVIPTTLIREAGEQKQLEVTYCIIDRAGNNSLWAPPREISVYDCDDSPS